MDVVTSRDFDVVIDLIREKRPGFLFLFWFVQKVGRMFTKMASVDLQLLLYHENNNYLYPYKKLYQ